MHYREVDWLPEVISYPELVEGYRRLGLVAAGCVVLDPGEEGIGPVAAAFDEQTQLEMAFENERPVPVLITPDGAVTVEVSEFAGSPSVRIRTLLRNGALVETLRRWDAIPSWPTSMRRAVRHLDIESEMTAHATLEGGRSVRVADGLPDELLAAHVEHVAVASALYGAEPYCLESMDDVVWVSNSAFAHAARVDARSTNLLLGGTAAVGALLVVLIVLGFLVSPWAWALAAAGAVLAYLLFFRALVALRYWSRIRPPYVQPEDGAGG